MFFIFLGDSFSQFRFAEEKEWDGEASCPKQVRWFVLNVVGWLFSRLETNTSDIIVELESLSRKNLSNSCTV